MRFFVAVWPPPDIETALSALPRPALDGLRWTTADQWHVTLRFLGEVAEPAPVRAAVAEVARVAPRVEVGLGPGPQRLGPGLLCVPVAGLEPLAASVVEATRSFGAPPEDRPFRGHLTLARSRRRLPRSLTSPAVDLSGRWTVDEVTLVRSHLSSAPARYDVVDRFPLGG